MLNLMSKTIIQAAQKQIDPPLLVPDDGFLLPIRTQPGGLNFFRAGTRETITPLNTGANIPIGLSMEEQRRAAIRQAFYVDQILTAGSPQMTATEVIQRQEERMRVIGPVLGRLMNELLRPLIDRVFALMLRADMLAVPPTSLQGIDIDVEYVSPLARAQKSSGLNNTMRALEILLPLSEGLPVADHIDPDGLVRHVTDSLGVPKVTLKSQREVNEVRQQRQQAQEEAAQRQRDQEDVYTTGTGGAGCKDGWRVKDIDRLKFMYRETFDTEHGQKVLRDLEARSNWRASSYVAGDANATAFEEGKRAVLLHIHNMMIKE